MARLALRRYLLVSTFLVLAIFSAAVSAQGDNNGGGPPPLTGGNNGGNNNNNNNGNTDSNTPSATGTNGNNQQSSTNTGDSNAKSSTDTNSSPSSTGDPTNTAGKNTVVITPTGTQVTITDNGPRPTISGSDDGSGAPKLTGLPTLTKTKQAIPTYPPPSPPPVANAPYMQRSSLPSGTVFIAVGAILGAFGATVLVWRAVVACLLHRSVKRAAMAQHIANDKASFPQPPAPFYKYSDRDSSPNLVGGAAGRGVRRTHRGPIPSATPSQTNLFFSPTAPGASTSGLVGGDRSSRYLPSGFYAAGSAASGSALGVGHGQNISMSNLRPDSRGHVRAVGTSPPDSPAIGPVGMPRMAPAPRTTSTSSINLNRPPSGRAPSAYLDDLLDDPNSGLPPAGGFPPVPNHQHNQSQSTLGRYGDR